MIHSFLTKHEDLNHAILLPLYPTADRLHYNYKPGLQYL